MAPRANFSKVSNTDLFYSKFGSKLTNENFYLEKRPVHSPVPQGFRTCTSPPDGMLGTSYTPGEISQKSDLLSSFKGHLGAS